MKNHPVAWEFYRDERRCADGCCSWVEEEWLEIRFDNGDRQFVPNIYLNMCREDAEEEANRWLLDNYDVELKDLVEL